jgi:hypothetical protein
MLSKSNPTLLHKGERPGLGKAHGQVEQNNAARDAVCELGGRADMSRPLALGQVELQSTPLLPSRLSALCLYSHPRRHYSSAIQRPPAGCCAARCVFVRPLFCSPPHLPVPVPQSLASLVCSRPPLCTAPSAQLPAPSSRSNVSSFNLDTPV